MCKVIFNDDNASSFHICPGQRRQCCGDLLLPRSQSSGILSSQISQGWPAKLLLWKRTRASSRKAVGIEHCVLRVLFGDSTRTSLGRKGVGAEDCGHHQLSRLPTGNKWRHWREPERTLCRRRHCCLPRQFWVKGEGKEKNERREFVTSLPSTEQLWKWQGDLCRVAWPGTLLQTFNFEYQVLRERVPDTQDSWGRNESLHIYFKYLKLYFMSGWEDGLPRPNMDEYFHILPGRHWVL